jgi:phage-related protein
VAQGARTAAVNIGTAATKAATAAGRFFNTTLITGTANFAKSTAATVASTAATVAHKVATIAVTAATKAAAVGQRLLNAAMSANPIGIIITLIAGLVAAFVLLWNKSDGFRNFILGVWETIKTGLSAAYEFIKSIPQKIVDGFNTVVVFFKELPSKIIEGVISLPGLIQNFFKQLPIRAIKGAISITKFGSDLLHKVWNGISALGSWLWGKIVTFAKNIPSNLVKGIGNMATIGKNLVEGVWNGIKNVTGWILEKIKGFGKSVLDGLKKIFGIKSPSEETAWMGSMIGEGLAKGIENTQRRIGKATAKMRGTVLGGLSGIDADMDVGVGTAGAPMKAGGGSGLTVIQNIYANETSYAAQQRQAAKQFMLIAREV